MPADLQLMIHRPYLKVQNAPETHPPVPDEVVIQELKGDVVIFADDAVPEREFKLTKPEFRAVYDHAARR